MFFRSLSIFKGALPLQLPSIAAQVPSDCALCGADGGGEICDPCSRSLPRSALACHRCGLPGVDAPRCGECLRRAPSFDAACAAFEYRFPVDALVLRFKYAGDLALGRWLARGLVERVSREPRPDAIVVPPSTRLRLRERGFNPALEIARHAGRALDLDVRRDMVVRAREDAPQAALSRSRRLGNLRGAFSCESRLAGADIVIVDDVMTTGATAEAMAAALKRAGAASVRVWAVARAPGNADV